MGRREWNGLMARYGQRVTLRRGETDKEIRAFFQPVEEKAPGEEHTPLGLAPAGKYLYLGPAEEDLDDVDELLWEGRAFKPIRHRGFPVGGEIVYRWAVAEELDEVRP